MTIDGIPRLGSWVMSGGFYNTNHLANSPGATPPMHMETFWSHWGGTITLVLAAAFIVLIMIVLIKYLPFWKREQESELTEEDEDIVPEDDEMRELLREYGRDSVQILTIGYQTMISESAALYKWILASLITLNGGAAVGVLSSSRLIGKPISGPVFLFILGCVLAILSALSGANGMGVIAPYVGRTRAHWMRAAKVGEVRADALVANRELTRVGRKLNRQAVAIGLGSLIAFVVGAAWLALVA